MKSTILLEAEKAIILESFYRLEENRTKVAKELNLGLRTVQRKLARYGIAPGVCAEVICHHCGTKVGGTK